MSIIIFFKIIFSKLHASDLTCIHIYFLLSFQKHKYYCPVPIHREQKTKKGAELKVWCNHAKKKTINGVEG